LTLASHNQKPIFVTGSHRSGSTWIGNMLSLSKTVRYIDEPFNLKYKASPFNYWFEYVFEGNEEKYLSYLRSEIKLSPSSLLWDLRNIQIRQDIKPMLVKWREQIFNKRPLFKDPIAILSAEWLAKKFNMDVLVIIRHPAAFVSSIKILEWDHDFSAFLKQPQLMNDYLSPFEDKIREFSKNKKDIVDQATLLWKIFHHVILQYQKKQPDWQFIRYEDITSNPIQEFEKIYQKLGLAFNNNIEQKILGYSVSKNTQNQQTIDPFSINRNAESNLRIWKQRLSGEEINKIRNEVEGISSSFYTDQDWN
jgi:hypothetical protein